jgi:hypothetical protein
MDSIYVSGPISKNVRKLEPFKTGSDRPGVNRGPPPCSWFALATLGFLTQARERRTRPCPRAIIYMRFLLPPN